jgi:hypothetical protein
MKPIEKDELYEHLGEFLRNKGIELKEGSYTKGIHAGCSLLADAINLSQAGIERARTGLDKKLDQVRQVIHEKTAPKRPPVYSAQPGSAAGATSNAPGANAGTKSAKRKQKRATTQGSGAGKPSSKSNPKKTGPGRGS